MVQSASSLDPESLEDPVPFATFHVAAAHRFLRENFERLADLVASFTADFLAFSEFQHKIFFILSTWLLVNVFVIFLTWYLYREKISDLLTNPRFVPKGDSSSSSSKDKKKKNGERQGAAGGGKEESKAKGDKNGGKNGAGGGAGSSHHTPRLRRLTSEQARASSRGRTRQRTPIRTRSISSTESSRRVERGGSGSRKQK